jgi:predicted RNA binding protein YcfA (HicA-like mRNA interferase family)
VSPKLPQVSGRDVLRVLRRAGFYEHHWVGSHCVMVRVGDDEERTVSVPVHGERPLKPGTLSKILRDAGLSRREFERLLRGRR